MDAIGFFNIVLRLTIWFLLTADLSVANIIIGVSIALLLPRSRKSLGALKDWLDVLWEIVVAIPQAYIEAIQIMLRPHNDEVLVCEKVKPKRTPGLIFLDIFLITFTPKSIVLKYHEQGWYEVHVVRRRKNK
ncbi:MAG: cation:proton antiporter [Okeania sp. SIO2C9]|uniref:Na+/H+ antiporter subunit E n=1 Tax=Okeania sp. SIO2C9 TaxID=2607791 RepID=UPI0013BF3ECC|nr:Na+/H+ antiporter subunit E [Okeania sp. SIO2C9]NEQ77335.1 cation:proton antiporter [Okeania sp. SIO2C9]